jgi:hypothetical protein
MLQLQMYTETPLKGNFAIPTDMSAAKQTVRAKKHKIDYHNVLPPEIIDTEMMYKSRAFVIRYCEEEVELNDFCEFRLEIASSATSMDTVFIMEVQLLFAELTKLGGVEKLPHYMANLKDVLEFKSTATKKYRIQNIAKGISQFIPIQFDGAYFCSTNAMMHSSLVDFRFRIVPDIDEKEPPMQSKKPPKKALPKTLAEYLFKNASGTMPQNISSQEVDRLYTEYVKVLAMSYDLLKSKFMDIQNKCINEKMKETTIYLGFKMIFLLNSKM